MKQLVLPIKDSQILQQVLETLRDDFKYGQRNYTLFQVGKATLLRVSDVIALKKSDVFDDKDRIMRNAYIVDKKTKKQNTLYLRPVKSDLLNYQNWLMKYQMHNPSVKVYDSPWLFPSFANPDNHISGHTYYEVMQKVGDLLGLNYLGTHTMRKTGAYRVYEQSNHNIGLVMKLLNHSSEAVTLNYLGLDQETREMILDNIDFGGLR
ncbi:tyrosine-type recombinase/integrase [Limosilactobacillus reuteri]|uniref:tyrosine-type recombinase/integrase n=1 Tax=Limosilactobacillus reuteri TaxID=1598 RepID=UPI001E593294|nr:tyrosine-type recombinase/integrase [Limosilactobacillus reuteri]MCC4485937.1 tyrosine-type recombinase/integrase [Limosilactobacillus reuteri]